MILLGFIWEPASAQTSSYGELQAAYLFNFAKYIKWPGEPQPFVIGVFGESAIITELKNTLKGKKVWGGEIEVREVSDVEGFMSCRVIYVPVGSSKKISSVKDAVDGNSILIVSEEDLIKKGATISFIIEDERLRFKLSRRSLSRTGLIATEGLLKLAILE